MTRPVDTRARLGASRSSAAKLPHERDESVGATAGVASGSVQQAYRDVARGLQDTDRGAEAGTTYRKLQAASAGGEDEDADPVGPVPPAHPPGRKAAPKPAGR